MKYILLFFLLYISDLSAQFNPKDLDALGGKAEIALNAKDGSFDRCFHNSSFVNRIIVSQQKREDLQKLNKKIKRDFSRFSISNALTKSPIDYTYKYIGTKKDSSLVFRQWDKREGGFNYLLLKANNFNNEWKIIDIYVLSNAQFMSESLKASIYMPAVIRLLDKDKGRIKMSNVEIFLDASKLLYAGDYQLAYNKISNIPLEERLTVHQILKINISGFLEEDDFYFKSIQEYRDLFPNDPALQLILMDKFIVDGNYSKVIESLDALKKHVLEDKFLNYYKGMMYLIDGDYKMAEKEIKIAIKVEKEEVVYKWMLIQLLESQANYKGCIKILKGMVRQLGYSKQELDETVQLDYSFLSLSKEYKRWFE